MAFQQTHRAPASRPALIKTVEPPPTAYQQQSHRYPALEDSQEWIVFSPDLDLLPDRGDTSSSPRTAGRSQLSDFGSLNTAALSARKPDTEIDPGARDEDETEELDSLDDGLHAFNDYHTFGATRRPLEQSADTVLPTHDGLGTFPGNSSPVQDVFWQHERYSPHRRRHSLRRSHLQRQVEQSIGTDSRCSEDQRTERIEKWRLEQSQAILEEIQRENRKRHRRSRHPASREHQDNSRATIITANLTQATAESSPAPESESFWQRFTRRVIRDLMGIDDATLSYIFGEALPDDPSEKPLSAAEMIEYAERTVSSEPQLTNTTGWWEERLLARIAKELGILMTRIAEQPGAFSTYLRSSDAPSRPRSGGLQRERPERSAAFASLRSPIFAPTLGNQHHRRRQSSATTDPSLWGIEEEDEDHVQPYIPSRSEEADRAHQERDYWERDLDVKAVFGFLRKRLASSLSAEEPAQPATLAVPPQPHRTPSTTMGTTRTTDSLRRAALIRHYHPLVSRSQHQYPHQHSAAAVLGSSSHALTPHSLLLHASSHARTLSGSLPSLSLRSAGSRSVLGRRQSCEGGGSSCASHSTKRSKTACSGSSRNYWDWDVGVGSSGPALSLSMGSVGG